MAGWIKLSRKLMKNPIWDNEKLLKVWLWCLLKASHSECEVQVGLQRIKLKQGQFVTGRYAGAEEVGFSPSTFHRHLKQLGEYGKVDIKTNNKFSLVTVVKWGFYQGINEEDEQHSEQQMNNKRTTNEQQMNTNKNGKNVKNEKKDIYTTEFEHFWSIYPKHIEKKKAFKCWNKLLKDGCQVDDLIQAATNYARFCADQKTEPKFIKRASTFLGPDKPFLDFVRGIPPDTRGHPPDEPKGFQAIRDWLSGEGKELNVFE